jgi:hypothetical protein
VAIAQVLGITILKVWRALLSSQFIKNSVKFLKILK